MIMVMLGCSVSAGAVTKNNADTEYQKGNYQQAIRDYEEILNNYGVSAEVYYNLGNAYYRTDNITKAVLNYERAHLLSPGDEDISFNLQFARSKTIDKITPESEMFFVTWWKALVNFTSVDCWAKTGIIAIIMALVLVWFISSVRISFAQDRFLRWNLLRGCLPAEQSLCLPAATDAHQPYGSHHHCSFCQCEEDSSQDER